ncbi:MAG: BMP family protein [Candidatus Odinarchaeota archaeon]
MQRRKSFSLMILLGFMVFAMVVPATNTTASVVKSNAVLDVAVVFATGGLGDLSFNDMAKVGLDRAKDEGLCTYVYVEPDEISEYAGLVEKYAADGTHDLIVSIGFDQATAVNDTAKAHPDQKIVLIDMVVVQGNVRSVTYNANEGSFMVGAMAAMVSQSGKVGLIGGMDDWLIREFWAGYSAGVFYENSSVVVVEDFVGDWEDPATAKSLAEAMFAGGADVIFVAAGKSGLGALEAAGEQPLGKYAIGVDADQDHLYKKHILTSMIKRVDLGVYNAIKDISDDDWIKTAANHVNIGNSSIVTMSLAQNGVDISPMKYTYDVVGKNNYDEVNVTIRNAIISNSTGMTPLPKDATELAAWKAKGFSSPYTPEPVNIPTGAPGFELLAVLSGLLAIPMIRRKRK